MPAWVLLPWLAVAVNADGAAAADNDVPSVGVQVDKNQGRVGDQLALTITTVGPVSTPVNLPANPELSPFTELGRKDSETNLGDGQMRRQFVLSLAAYQPGDLVIPAVEITYLGKGGDVRTVRTTPVPVKIVSLLANEPEPGLKENALPVRVLEDNYLPLYVMGGLAIAGLGAVLALIIRRRLRARAQVRPAPPPRPAHEVALERLDRLGAAGLGDDFDHRPFYFQVSEIVRDYLGARFGFDSLELTTEELVEEMRQRAEREMVLGEIAGWLSACDLVKFAKFSPSVTEARGTLENAIRIVEATRPRSLPPVIPGVVAREGGTHV